MESNLRTESVAVFSNHPPRTYIEDPTATAAWLLRGLGKGATALHVSLDGEYFSTKLVAPALPLLKTNPPVT
jgi:hypothetical protein